MISTNTQLLDKCINKNSLNKVQSGEVCSIDTAKKLGIFDKDNYYIKGYEKIKTFNTLIDNKDNRSLELCNQNDITKTAKPLCTLSSGINYIPSIKNGKNVCTPIECPSGFTVDNTDPSICIKPTKTKIVSLNSQNNERWYDWFTIPNYHIGNKYNSLKDVHYAPCKGDTVPIYDKDPVDNESKGVVNDDNTNIGKCLSKEYYFGGKYANSENYSPLALIKRINTSEELREEVAKIRRELLKEGSPTDKLNQMLDDKYINQEVKEIIKLIDKGVIDNPSSSIKRILTPTATEKIASKKMHTKERLEEAYNKCYRLQSDETAIYDELVKDGTSRNIADVKIKTAKAACQLLFNEKYDGLHNSINKKSLNFRDIEKEELDDVIKIKKEYEDENKDTENEPITSNKEKANFKASITNTFRRSIMILFIVIIIIFIVFIVYPVLKYIYIRYIKPLFTKRVESKELSTLKELNNQNLSNIKK